MDEKVIRITGEELFVLDDCHGIVFEVDSIEFHRELCKHCKKAGDSIGKAIIELNRVQ